MKRSKRHQDVVNDYDVIKSKYLDKLATKMLANDEKMSKLKEKEIDPKFLNLF
jgi:hypothetical protein